LKDAIGFHAAPVRNGDRKATFHAREAGPQIFLLARERRFQNALKNLFMTELQSLLDSRVWIERGKSGMVISAAGEIPQGSDVCQAGK